MIKVTPIPEKNKYSLDEDIYFMSSGNKIFIPAGFLFDGASIPRAFWSIIGSPFDPDFMEPACIHDYCFITKCTGFIVANNLFKSRLKKNRVGYFRRILMWSAVASAGLIFWNKPDIGGLKMIHKLIKGRWDKMKFECDIKSEYYLVEFKNRG